MVNIISAILVGKNAEVTVMALEGSLKDCLLCGKELSDDEISVLKDRLCSKTVQELRILAKGVNVRLTGSSRKVDIVDRLIGMARIGATRDDLLDEDVDFTGISYITDEVRSALRSLPAFFSVKEWNKKLNGVLKDFTFTNLLIYLVYGRDKSFDMQSLKAFKSLKAYKFYYNGFVKNVWVHEFPISESELRILYFRAYVHHSLTCDAPLETYVALNGDNGDVYSAQCTCVSG